MRQKQRWAGLTLALSLFLSGCGGAGLAVGPETTQVRFVAVAVGSPEMDLYVNGAGAAYGLAYQSFTSYLPVVPGSIAIAAQRAGGTGQPLTTLQGNFSAGQQVTVLVGPGSGGPQARAFADQKEPAPAGEMAVRVLDAVQSAAPLTVFIAPAEGSGRALSLRPLVSGEASSYLQLPAGQYTLTATLPEGNLHLPLGSVTLKANSGAVRSVVFSGAARDAAHGHVTGFSLSDADPQEQ